MTSNNNNNSSNYNNYPTPNLELLLGGPDVHDNNNNNTPGAYPTASSYPSGNQFLPPANAAIPPARPVQSSNGGTSSLGSTTNSNNKGSMLSSSSSSCAAVSTITTSKSSSPSPPSSNVNAEFPGRGDQNNKYSSVEYLKLDLGMNEDDISMARMEHVDPEADMCLSDEQLRDYAGTAIFVYFRFLKFISIVIAIHFVLSLINYVMFATSEKPEFATSIVAETNSTRYWYSDFFITSYTKSQRGAYLGTTIAGLVVIILGLIIYRQFWIGWFKFADAKATLAESEEVRKQGKDYSSASDAIIIRYTDKGYIDVAAHYRSNVNLTLRRLTSFLIFCAFVAVQAFSSVMITRKSDGAQSLRVSFAIAFIAAILNLIFTMLCRKLTEFEKYELMERADRSLVIKLICFKISNIMAVYGAKRYGNTSCVYDVIGEQFMTLLLVEIFFVTPSSIAMSAFLTRNKQTYAKLTGGILGDDRYRAQFELPVEYLAALYKFCIAAMAMVVFPLSTLLGFVAFFVEFWAARYRLIKLCGKPEKSDTNHRNVVVFVTFLIFVAVIATPFAGAAFILSGRSMLETNTTRLCNGFPQVPP